MALKVKVTETIALTFPKKEWTLLRVMNQIKRHYDVCHITIDDLTSNVNFKITLEPLKVLTPIDVK